MWLSTNRKSDGGKNGSSSSKEFLSTNSGAAPAEDWQSSLPLDWTRIKRRGPRFDNNKADDSLRNERIGSMLTKDGSCESKKKNVDNNENEDKDSCQIIEGQAIFCLHDLDPSWIQGYFIRKGSRKPWGMLAVQEEVDDCMACCAGGYRRLSLTVFHHHRSSGKAVPRKRRRPRSPIHSDLNQPVTKENPSDMPRNEPWNIQGVDWTGGDMMALHHPDHVDMKGERLFTGEKALPMLHKYFQNLINRLEKELRVEECSSVLDWLPNAAIITGPMSFRLPQA
mmetsp:Transcript_26963/g.74126  ORF Transcript_26963/g.74126 Transcript_26963/m.74126 type:complete len:281 (-) Transcript_26963:1306-2148(-)